jgi:hypothetical protein
MTNVLARYCNNPQPHHIAAAKRVIEYLNSTPNLALAFGANGNTPIDGSNTCMTISAFSDADWGGDHDTRRSTTGSIIMLNGNIVAWNSTRQHTVATSSTEAEYMALSDTAKDLKWFNSWLSEVLLVVPEEFKLITPSTINVDNTAAIALTKAGAPHARTKHIDVRYHFVREKIANNELSITWTPTTKQLADLLTKRLPTPTFQLLVSQLLYPIGNTTNSLSG